MHIQVHYNNIKTFNRLVKHKILKHNIWLKGLHLNHLYNSFEATGIAHIPQDVIPKETIRKTLYPGLLQEY